MNKDGRKQIDEFLTRLHALAEEVYDIKNGIENLRDEEEGKFDNMTESLQQGEKGQAIEAAKDALTEAFDSMDEIDIDGVIENLETAKE